MHKVNPLRSVKLIVQKKFESFSAIDVGGSKMAKQQKIKRAEKVGWPLSNSCSCFVTAQTTKDVAKVLSRFFILKILCYERCLCFFIVAEKPNKKTQRHLNTAIL